MKENKVLFFSYWYPNKVNRIFPVFVKKHAQAIHAFHPTVVLSLSLIHGPFLYRKSSECFVDENGIETHQVYIESRFYKLLYMLLPLHYLVLKKYLGKKLLPAKQFTILHSNILFPCAIVGFWLSRHFQWHHVMTEHWSKLDQFFKKNPFRRSGKKALDRSHALTCVSGLLQETLRKYTTNPDISIVPNVIDEHDFFYDPTVRKQPVYTFIAVANWTPPKNPFYFLDVLQIIWNEKSIGNFELCLVGNGPQLEEVKKRGYSFKITYPGVINASELAQKLNQSHMFLHGSDYETFSTIIAEALMCGLPSVVSPVGIAAEVINPSNGFIADNSVPDWKKKILLCYNTAYDPAAIAGQLKNKYNLRTVGAMFSEIYGNISQA
jgi:glycosyltransferase involved in cell wall biosynthesis